MAPPIAVLADSFLMLSETFIAAEVEALQRTGLTVRVESTTRPPASARADAGRVQVAYLEDDSIGSKLRDLAWLVARHPLASARDVAERRRWHREEKVLPLRSLAPAARRIVGLGERHLHAHFAAGAALNALRLSRLLGLPYSVTAHAFDIYRERRNLREKLERSAFATSGCDYTVRTLRELVGPRHAERIHEIVMGVDGERFQREAPYPGGRVVVAVGRLVEKKGFRHLLDAAALLRDRFPLDRVAILGDGPLGTELRAHTERLGVTDEVEWLGARPHGDVRTLLEGADLLAMPCVVARDGDRDSMPVVVKEALAMEVPVVASDEVGLPELVRPEFGRLVPPGDPRALADAIEDVLRRPRAERVAMGRAGREWVLERCDVMTETERLARLIEAATEQVNTRRASRAAE